MKKQKLVKLVFCISILPILSFQNCSEISPQDITHSEALQNEGGQGVIDIVDTEQPVPPVVVDEVEDKEDDKVPGDVVDTDKDEDKDMDEDKGEDVADNDTDKDEDKDMDEDKEEDVADNDTDKDEDKDMDDDKEEDVANNDTDKEQDEDTDEPDAIDDLASCLVGNIEGALTGDTFLDLHGKNVIASNSIKLITNGSGNLTVQPASGVRGHIEKLESRGGRIVLCNMDIDEIDNTHGNLNLINCKVGKISDSKGVIKNTMSTIEETDAKNIKGKGLAKK